MDENENLQVTQVQYDTSNVILTSNKQKLQISKWNREERTAIINKIMESDKTMDESAIEFGVARQTLLRWIRIHRKKKAPCEEEIVDGIRHVYTRAEVHMIINEALFAWYLHNKSSGIQMNHQVLTNKALYFQERLGTSNSLPTRWLQYWRTRYGVRRSPDLEKSTKDLAIAKEYVAKLKKTIAKKSLTPDQVFSCFETPLKFKVLPAKIEPSAVSALNENGPDKLNYRDVVRLFLCSNASGTLKLPLLVIGRYKEPRGLENCKSEDLPASYTYNTNTWVSKKVFLGWYTKLFVPKVKKFMSRKHLTAEVLLLIDNVLAHPSGSCDTQGDLQITFVQTDTRILESRHKPIIDRLKKTYRLHSLKSIVRSQKKHKETLAETLKKINIKDAISLIAKAWEEVTRYDIQISWKPLWSPKQQTEKNCPRNLNVSVLNLLKKISGARYISPTAVSNWILHEDELSEWLTEDEIFEIVETNFFQEKMQSLQSLQITEKEGSNKVRLPAETHDDPPPPIKPRGIKRKRRTTKFTAKKRRKNKLNSEESVALVERNQNEILKDRSPVTKNKVLRKVSRKIDSENRQKPPLTRSASRSASRTLAKCPQPPRNKISTRIPSIVTPENNQDLDIHPNMAKVSAPKTATAIRSDLHENDNFSQNLETHDSCPRETKFDNVSPRSACNDDVENPDNYILRPEMNDEESSTTFSRSISPEFHENLISLHETKSELFARVSNSNSVESDGNSTENSTSPRKIKSERLTRSSSSNLLDSYETLPCLRNLKNEQLNIVSNISISEFHHSLDKVIMYCDENNAGPEYLTTLLQLRDEFNT